MIEKRKNCTYCGKEMESQTAKKRFCSDKCRVYYQREKKRGTLEHSELEDEIKVKSEKIWYDAKALKLLQDFEKKQHEKLPPEFHESLDRVITSTKNKMAESGEYDFTGVVYLNVEHFTKFPESSRPKTMGEAIDWQKKRDADVANIKTAWNNWKKQTF